MKGQGRAELIGSLIIMVFLLAIAGAIAVYKAAIPGGESEGTVKFDDCRQIITIKRGDWVANFKSFVCKTSKTNSGKSMGGICVYVETTADGKCQKALVYDKKPDMRCSASDPWLGTDDTCWGAYAAGRVYDYEK